MFGRIRNFLNKWKYFNGLLPFSDALQFFASSMTGKEKLISTEVGGVSIQLRTCTSDLAVAKEAFIEREYAFISSLKTTVIIDAGANIGTSAIAFAEQFPEAAIHAIEMEPSNFRLLKENSKPYPNIFPHQLAIAASTGRRSLRDRNTGHWGFSIAETDAPTSGKGPTVETITLDDLMDRLEITHIDVLKIDIEGAEKEIFETGGDWLSKTDSLVVELHDRIIMGCSRAFYLSTVDFAHFEQYGEKVYAYRNKPISEIEAQ
ncbi:MAG: FkbM family methyltransferase [Verrucomicrobiales bacterium]|nr:FkbM family methyltransferase [Verrucomicrobiales bacterium]